MPVFACSSRWSAWYVFPEFVGPTCRCIVRWITLVAGYHSAGYLISASFDWSSKLVSVRRAFASCPCKVYLICDSSAGGPWSEYACRKVWYRGGKSSVAPWESGSNNRDRFLASLESSDPWSLDAIRSSRSQTNRQKALPSTSFRRSMLDRDRFCLDGLILSKGSRGSLWRRTGVATFSRCNDRHAEKYRRALAASWPVPSPAASAFRQFGFKQ